jgi:enterochelin esterase family protein
MSSSVPEFDKELADASALNRQLKLLWFACGKDDPLLKRNADFDALLTTRGIRHEFAQTEGNHTWPVWRKHLATFVPLLFQGNAHER